MQGDVWFKNARQYKGELFSGVVTMILTLTVFSTVFSTDFAAPWIACSASAGPSIPVYALKSKNAEAASPRLNTPAAPSDDDVSSSSWILPGGVPSRDYYLNVELLTLLIWAPNRLVNVQERSKDHSIQFVHSISVIVFKAWCHWTASIQSNCDVLWSTLAEIAVHCNRMIVAIFHLPVCLVNHATVSWNWRLSVAACTDVFAEEIDCE